MAQLSVATDGPTFTPWAGDDGPPPSPLASNPVPSLLQLQSQRRHSTELNDTRVRGVSMARSKPSSASKLLAENRDAYRISFGGGLDDDELILGHSLRGGRRGREDVTLVDFLRNAEPPPDNYMSIPYEYETTNKDRGRWAILKRVGRKRSRSVPRGPLPLQLPDTAICGTTIGGHRHIAISIPLDATPFADAAKSQYPVYTDKDDRKVPRNELPVRTYTDNNGVVTVLRATGATNASPSAHSPSNGLRPLLTAAASSEQRRHKVTQSLPSSHYKTSSQSTTDTQRKRDYLNIFPSRTDTPHAEEAAAAVAAATRSNSMKNREKNATARDFQRSLYPTRGSSMTANRSSTTKQLSIDGMIAQSDGKKPPAAFQGYDSKPLPKAPVRELMNHLDIKRSRPGTTQPSPISEESHEGSGESINTIVKQVITTSPVVSLATADNSCPSSPSSIKSRRDKVRDKKKRDMEALRSARSKSTLRSVSHTSTAKETEGETLSLQPSPAKSTKSTHTTSPGRQTSKSTLCPIVVVLDVEPTIESPIRITPDTPPLQDSSGSSSDNMSHQTPPTSFSGSPIQKNNSQSSRKSKIEWGLNQEERKARETLRAKALHQAANENLDDSRQAHLDKQILRLYDTYRENRMREMERRLRRLERNGDVWLRALVPVLDDMNRVVRAAQIRESESAADREYMSDHDALGATEREARQAQRPRPARNTSLTRERLMAELLRRGSQSDDWSDTMSRSDGDFSGMGSIEPLMRELAGEARRRQRQVAAQALEGGFYHAL